MIILGLFLNRMDDLAKKAALFFKDKPVKKAYVFGSAARGDAGADSDIDILVDLDYDKSLRGRQSLF
jgi:predicted nucleotidyltransferase